jgi:hypothetical protein
MREGPIPLIVVVRVVGEVSVERHRVPLEALPDVRVPSVTSYGNRK